MTAQNLELSAEVAEAAAWLQGQLDNHPFCDAGVTLSQHEGQVRRIDRTLTTKTKPTGSGGNNGTTRYR